jgi:hypothetical protein
MGDLKMVGAAFAVAALAASSALVAQPALADPLPPCFVDDQEGKPVGITRHIGQRPIFAAGNSDGDVAMLDRTTAGDGPRFGMLIHHTDGERKFAYGRQGHVGVLNQGLDEALARGWLVVDMVEDWERIWTGRP